MSGFKTGSDYIFLLKAVVGTEFQEEIEKLYSDSFPDFQPIHAPGGDGGCDGLFRGHKSAICCYGLDLKIADLDAESITDKIKNKFIDDLKRLLEIKTSGRGKNKKFELYANDILESYYPSDKKIDVIHLVVNHDDLKLIKYFTDEFEKLKKESRLKFIDPNCQVIFVGFSKLKTICNISDNSLTRLKHKGLIDAVQQAFSFEPEKLPEPEKHKDDFFDKFSDLKKLYGNTGADLEYIEEMQEEFYRNWCRYIAFTNKMQKTSPNLYQRILELDASVIKEIKREIIGNTKTPDEKIDGAGRKLQDKWLEIFDNNSSAHSKNLIDMDLANLVGTCPLDWRKGKKGA